MQDLYHLEADLPAKDVKIKELKNTVDELQSELEVKSREIDKLRNENKTLINRYIQQKESKRLNEKDSGMYLEEKESPKERDVRVPSQSTEPDSLEVKEKDSKMLLPSFPKPLKYDYKVFV